jgi:hypothetical protein
MDFIVSVKDGYVTAVGKYFGNELKPTEAIQAALDKKIEEAYPFAVKEDPAVLAKEEELKLLIEQKIAETKEVKGK